MIRMANFRVPLNAKHFPLERTKRRNCRCASRGENLKTGRGNNNLITVRHPGVLFHWLTSKKWGQCGIHCGGGGAVFAKPRLADLATELLGHDLKSIANT